MNTLLFNRTNAEKYTIVIINHKLHISVLNVLIFFKWYDTIKVQRPVFSRMLRCSEIVKTKIDGRLEISDKTCYK